MNDEAIVIIPARYASRRLPGKPLIQLAGKPLIQWVYQRALQIPGVERVIVATDDHRIAKTVRDFRGEVKLTPSRFNSGTERVGFIARDLTAGIIVNLQGDEPLVPPTAVGNAIEVLRKVPQIKVVTLGCPINSKSDWQDPSVVKVLVDADQNALIFTRSPIPYFRDTDFHPLTNLWRHIGAYIFRKDFLLQYLDWPVSSLERVEKLEQLRILERGYKIRVIKAPRFTPGVDTRADVKIVEKLIEQEGI